MVSLSKKKNGVSFVFALSKESVKDLKAPTQKKHEPKRLSKHKQT
jgi:hypothetical protein